MSLIRLVFAQVLLVVGVLPETRTDASKLGDVIAQLLDGLYLLRQEVTLDPVTHLQENEVEKNVKK